MAEQGAERGAAANAIMKRKPKVADEHQTGVLVWKGKRVTEVQWKKLRAKENVLFPPGLADSSLINQVDWLTRQMIELANILRLPADSTLKDLVPTAEQVMKKLEELREFERLTTRPALDGYARPAEPIWDSRNSQEPK